MGWNYDRPPIEYLERRVKYYRKKIGSTKGLITRQWLITKYGKRQLKKIIKLRIEHCEARIKEFEQAISILQKYMRAGLSEEHPGSSPDNMGSTPIRPQPH